MSVNLSDFQPERDLLRRVADLERIVREKGTLQIQGSEALQVGIIEGYVTFEVPEDTAPHIQLIDVTAPTDSNILIGSLVYSIYAVGGGLLFNLDILDSAIGDEEFAVWMAYEGRSEFDAVPVSLAATQAAKVADNVARVAFRLRRSTTDTPPIGLDQYVVLYQIRATLA